ncbi:rhomboid family intramembrane serine protease [Candidatus Bathyarchaeota archaeon]|nr:rhomboid family intramembrane serine protease [Candidatus Bathyarchaeota archaeon]
MRTLPKLTPTSFLVMANLLVYIYTSVVGFIETSDIAAFIETSRSVLYQWGQFNYYVMNGGYWQLLTSIFVHVDIIHLSLNMFFLLIFGFRADELFNPEEYFFIYFLSGLSGNLLTLLLMHPLTLSAGASGAIFGIFGACVIYLRKTFGQSIVGALLFSFLLLVMTAGRGVNVFAHFGGLAAGLIIGYALAKSRKIVF